MKTLYPKQREAFDFFVNCQKSGSNTLDSSHVGTGKTVVAAHLAKELNRPVAVLCPKAVIPSWQRELAEIGIDPLFVLNYEKIRTGKTDFMSKRGKKIMQWKIPKDAIIFVDEVHKCKGPYTQNAQLLVSLVTQGYSVHAMSATAAEDPTEMRPLGFALGLHNLNKSDKGMKSWFSWMMQYGCFQNEWNAWELKREAKLKDLNKVMYNKNVKKLTVEDFPDSFKENRVFIEPVAFGSATKIAKAYKDLDITPEIITNLIENGTVEDSDWVLVNLLRARQLAESLKAKDMADMAKDYVEQGHSVVLFVNFTDTVDTLCELLECMCIKGGQKVEDRQDIIDAFQRDEEHVLVINTAAGGTGISLHDINGNRQRISLISPTFNVKDHLQALGRIHRNGAKSDAIQKILVASDSIEEHVMRVVEQKSDNLNTLHQ
jgi:superfamily II DNA or RNA helicase